MTDRVSGRVPILSGLQAIRTEVVGSRINLITRAADGQEGTLTADHVVTATGYRVDINKLAFLDDLLKKGVKTSGGAPVLSSNFESSEPGLYFVGAASAATFGPVMRFVAGAGFTVRNLSRRLASGRSLLQGQSAPSEIRLVKWGGKNSN